MEWWFLLAGGLCAVASGVIAIGYAESSRYEPRFGTVFIFGTSALMLAGLVGILAGYCFFHAWLLEACAEKDRIMREREFACVVPVMAHIKDGKVDHFTLPRAGE